MGPIPYYKKVAGGAFTLTFPGFTTVLDTEGDYQYIITSNVSGDPSTIGAYDVVKTPTSLTITPIGSTQDFTITVIPFNQTGPISGRPRAFRSMPKDVPIVIPLSGMTTNLDAEGDYQYVITSNITGDPATLGQYDVTKTPASLTITPRLQTQDFRVTIVPFYQTGPLQAIEPISKRYRAIDLYTEACEDAHADTAVLNHFERFMLLNRASLGVIGQFYGLVSAE